MRVTKLLDVSGIGQTTSPSPEPYASKTIFNSDGIVQISATNAPTVKIQGRAAPDAPWIDIILNAAGDKSTTTDGYFTIPLFPEIRATVAAGASNAVVSVWLAD